MGVLSYGAVLALSACLLSTVSCTLSDIPDISVARDNDILSALSWVAFDFNHLSHGPDYGLLASSFEGFNSSAIGSRSHETRSRRKRTISFEVNNAITADLEYRFKIPLFEVYESTFFMFEIPINYQHILVQPDVQNDQSRGWMKSLPSTLTELEEVVSLLGVDGKACVKRTFCELAASPTLQPQGLVGEMIQVFVNYLASSQPESINEIDGARSLTNEYIQAGLNGRQDGRCWEVYPDCPISLLNLFSKDYY